MNQILNVTGFVGEGNIKKVAELFPNCVVETEDEGGNKVKKIDFDILRAEL